MSPSMKIRTTTLPLFILFVLGVFALPQRAQPVTPPPDGGYPGGNTAEGQSALLSLTTGGFNTAIGFLSLRSNATGAFNTAIGAGTLALALGLEKLSARFEASEPRSRTVLNNP